MSGIQISSGERRVALQSVLTSKTFRASDGQRAFLQYAGEQSIAGAAAAIKEYSIGVEVFGRGEDFDPRLDPIVRVMARKLRAGLVRYYAAEGRLDPVAVELPKGSYVPEFVRRIPADPATTSTTSVDGGAAQAEVTAVASSSTRWNKVAAGIAIAVAGAVLGLLYAGLRDVDASPTPSVAVLPFVALADDAQDTYLADGLTADLTATLERIPGLRVAGRASAFRFRGPTNLREAGEQLHVHTLLEGVIRKSGDRFHLTVQLVNAANGYKLWAETYDRTASELPSVRREVSQSVVNAIGVSVPEENPEVSLALRQAKPNQTRAGEAYQDYLKGRHFWGELSAASLETARKYFEQALSKDPSYAPAYSGLAACYAMIPQLTDARTPEMSAKIRSAAKKALELDSTLGEAHVALAMAAAYEFDWPKAEQEYRIGLALNPGDPVAHLWFGGYLTLTGRLDEALVQRRMAAELDPLSLYAQEALARTYYVAHRYDDAVRQYKRVLAANPNFGLAHHGLGRAYLQMEMYQEGIAELLWASRLLGATPRRKATLAYAYAKSGRRVEARRTLSEFLEAAKRGPFPAVVIAEIYVGLGEREQALHWLRKVIDQKDLFSKSDPLYDSLRSDPRFIGLLSRINL